MKIDFVAIDVETANADMSSICQIGIARYENGILSEEWCSYVDPEDYFDGINISIHGIDESKVRGAPNYEEITNKLYRLLDDRISVCHTHFDRVAINQACEKYKVRTPECKWLDSARVARRTWEAFAWSGYGLYNVCTTLGYQFNHHNALEDAKAAGKVLIAAIERSGLDIDGWLERIKHPIDPSKFSSGKAIKREGNPEGPLYGEIVVFTGALEIPRYKASDLAAKIGCQVEPRVTKNTTILIVGDQDVKKLAGQEKSSKHRKAEKLISQGISIKILRESDFKELAKLSV